MTTKNQQGAQEKLTSDTSSQSTSVSTSREARTLMRRRTGLKAELAAHIKFAKEFAPSPISFQLIEIRLEQVNAIVREFHDIQPQIEALDDQDEDHQTRERIEFNEMSYEAKAMLITLSTRESSVVNSARTDTINSESVRLPTVPPPVFDGNLQNWSSFRDSFDAMFHDNKNLADVQKLHYLKSCMSGTAGDIIKNLPTTSENYQRAYDALIARYENKSLTIQSHIRLLLDTSKVKNACASELRQLHHHVTSHVRALEALGQPDLWDAWLVTLVCSRMDGMTAGKWQLRQSTRELPSFAELEAFLVNRVSAYEVSDLTNTRSSSEVHSTKTNYQAHQRINDKKSLHVQMGFKCPICSGNHKTLSCTQFNNMSIENRRQLVSKNRLCFNCLSPGHQVLTCRSSHKCMKCGKRHHSLLHQEYQETRTSNTPCKENEEVVPQPGNSSMLVGVDEAYTSLLTQSNMQVLLATVSIQIRNSAGKLSLCRAVLDSGSQVNSITRECARRLGLSMTNVNIPVVGIGLSNTKSQQCCETIICSRVENTKFSVQLHVLSQITSHLPTQMFKTDQFVIPTSIQSKLADPKYNQPGEVDILIGAELFFSIMKTKKYVISQNASFQDTVFGY